MLQRTTGGFDAMRSRFMGHSLVWRFGKSASLSPRPTSERLNRDHTRLDKLLVSGIQSSQQRLPNNGANFGCGTLAGA